MIESKKETLNDFDDIPVIYCKFCHSLNIQNYSDCKSISEGCIDDFDYCAECGSTDLGICSIDEFMNIK